MELTYSSFGKLPCVHKGRTTERDHGSPAPTRKGYDQQFSSLIDSNTLIVLDVRMPCETDCEFKADAYVHDNSRKSEMTNLPKEVAGTVTLS